MTPRSLLALPPLWRETRIGLEAAALLRHPIYRGEGVANAGGQPVMLIPGFLAGDDSLGIMTRWLRRTGHHTSKAGMRSNVDCSSAALARLEERLEIMAETRGEKVAIVGQSRGGNFAKVLARRRPELVSGIVALGSPQRNALHIHPVVRAQVFAVGMLGTIGAKGLFNYACLRGDCCRSFWEDLRGEVPPEVGYVSIYSKTDGVVNWRACLDDGAHHVEVRASHCGMAVNVSTYEALATALADFRASGRGPRGRTRAEQARTVAAKRAGRLPRAA
jgi:pimeloyl-ACP methyl ester carboxylesterase